MTTAEADTLGAEPALAATLDAPARGPDTIDRILEESLAVGAGGTPAAMPTRVSRYLIIRELGQGGMGVVYLAYDPDLDRRVAIKLIRSSSGETSLARARVQQEAQALARVSHPNVVHVYEVGQSAGQVYLAMEYIKGVSLLEWQRPRGAERPSVEQILRIYLQTAAGLVAAHRSGLVHRDFKPDNVLLGDDGRPRVLDFGLARALHGEPSLEMDAVGPDFGKSVGARITRHGAIMGTPGFMSPEQVQGKEADARSDQFSFCAALYEALYQQLPFGGETFSEFARDVLAGHLRTPPASEVPISVEQALRRGLSVNPDARYPSMHELITDLEAGLNPDTESPATRQASRRFGVLLAAGVGLTIVSSTDRSRPIDGDIGPGVLLAVMFCFLLVSTVVALRRTLLRRRRYRRLVFFEFVCAGYLLLGRLIGYWLGVKSGTYLPLEMVGIGGLFALETPNADPRYARLAALACTSALLLVLLPRYFWPILNTTYMLLLVLSVWYRLEISGATLGRSIAQNIRKTPNITPNDSI